MNCLIVLIARLSAIRRPANRCSRHAGVSLVEVLASMAVLSIILASAAPGFVSFLQSQLVRGLAQELATDLMLARSEAVKRNLPVSVVSTSSGFAGGWTVMVGSERLSSRNRPLQTVVFANAPEVITFDENGRVTPASSNIRISIFGGSATRCVELDLSGRARTQYGVCA